MGHKLRKVVPICWHLNDLNRDEKVLETFPSAHLLVCGGAGSGKSVLLNNIFYHINKFPYNFQAIGLNLKLLHLY